MAKIRNFRTARLLVGVLVIVVMGLGAHQLMASSGDNMAPEDGLVIGGPPPSCPATLGDCKQIKNSCCYRCPGVNFIICIDF